MALPVGAAIGAALWLAAGQPPPVPTGAEGAHPAGAVAPASPAEVPPGLTIRLVQRH